jgi:hypothetical protein
MITVDDAVNTVKLKDRFVILSPELKQKGIYEKFSEKVPEDFSFSSDTNDIWFNDETFLTTLIDAELI